MKIKQAEPKSKRGIGTSPGGFGRIAWTEPTRRRNGESEKRLVRLKESNPCDKKMGALPKKLNKEADKLGPQKACRQKQKSSTRQIRRVEAKQLRYRTVAKIK